MTTETRCTHGETTSECMDCLFGAGRSDARTETRYRAPVHPRIIGAPLTPTSDIYTLDARAFRTPAFDANAMSDKQRGFLTDLIAKRGTDLHRTLDLDDMTRWDASRLIDELLKLPYRASAPVASAPKPYAPAPQALPEVADGRYAIDIDGATKFYRVSHGRDGRLWLNVFASDNQFPVHAYATKLAVLTEIARDARAAMSRFGQLIGACGVCGRTLTDADSRERGIGPICIGRWNA